MTKRKLQPAISPRHRRPHRRLKPLTLAQIKLAQEAAVKAEIAANQRVALSQPHRRGNDDPKLESAFGRFVIAHKLPEEIWKAGEEFAGLMRRWRSAMEIPGGPKLGGVRMDDPSAEMVAGWLQAIREAENAMDRECGRLPGYIVRRMLLEDETASAIPMTARAILRALARHLGHLPRQ